MPDQQTPDFQPVETPGMKQGADILKKQGLDALMEPIDRMTREKAGYDYTAAREKANREQAGAHQETQAAQGFSSAAHQAAGAFNNLPPEPKFNITPDTHEGLMGLAAILPIAGILVGSKGQMSGINAMNAMTGVLKGYQEGNQQRIEFEKQKYDAAMKEWKNHYDTVKEGFTRALELAKTDYQAGIAKAHETAAKVGSPELKAMIDSQGIGQAAQRFFSIEEQVAKSAAKTGGGMGSAFARSFESQVNISINEAARQIGNLKDQQFATSGWFGGEKSSGIWQAPMGVMANKLTPEAVQQYNNEISNLGLEFMKIVNGGRQVPIGAQKMAQEQFRISEGAKPFTVLETLSNMRQKFEKAIEVKMLEPQTSPEMKQLYGRALEEIQTAIPFTTHDVLMAQKEARGNKSFTFGDYMQKKMGGGGEAAASGKPSLNDFMTKARAANPGVSDAELTEFYNKKYGGQ